MSTPIERIRKALAGREMDALVAEKVMGFTDNRPDRGTAPGEGGTGRAGEMWGIMDWLGTPVWALNVPRYSTDIAAAWEVVEKMESRGWGWTADKRSAAGEDFQYVWRFHQGAQIHRAEERTVPVAICLAALRAVGVEP